MHSPAARTQYECTEPEFVSKDVVVAAATGPLRVVVRRIDFTGGFLRLRHGSAPGGPDN